MRITSFFTGLTLAMFCVIAPARSDGLFYQLPADGTWVRYALELKTVADGREQSIGKGTMTVSSVGSIERDKEKCRWIEIVAEVTVERDGATEKITEATKLLVPEKYLTAGQNPAEHVLAAWKKTRDDAPRELDLASDDARTLRSMDEILCGPAPETKKLPKASMDGRLGIVECEGVRGIALPGSYESRLHAKAPFGVVTYRAEKTRGNRSRVMELKLAEFGTDAKSSMPAAK